MLSPENFTLLTILMYLLASVCGFCGLLGRGAALRRAGCLLAIAAFFCQTFFLLLGFHKFLPAGVSLGAYLQLLAWFFLLCGICAWWRMGQDSILLLAAPSGLILFLVSAPWLDVAVKVPETLSAPFYALHIGALFLSLGLLFLAFVAGLLFVFLEKLLKAKKMLKGVSRNLPALSLLDKINSVAVLSAFPLYTLGIFAGLFWARSVFGKAVSGDPKEIFSIFVWLLLAALFHNRLAKGWKGRKPAVLAIVIFILSVFSFMVINSLFSINHSFIRN